MVALFKGHFHGLAYVQAVAWAKSIFLIFLLDHKRYSNYRLQFVQAEFFFKFFILFYSSNSYSIDWLILKFNQRNQQVCRENVKFSINSGISYSGWRIIYLDTAQVLYSYAIGW